MLDEKLIASYRTAEYKIFSENQIIVVRVDYYSSSMAALLTISSADCAAIISAYNPYSQLRSEEENILANELLKEFLIKNNHRFLESLNIDPTEAWPSEKSFLVLNLDCNTAKNIGWQFSQNAIIWIDQTAVAQLILLR